MDPAQNQTQEKNQSTTTKLQDQNFSQVQTPQINQTNFTQTQPEQNTTSPPINFLQTTDQEIPPLKQEQKPPEQPQQQISQKKTKRKFSLFKLLLFLFLIFLPILIAGVVYAIAYQKIRLSGHPKIQASIANFVISLPFMPKTPEFLLTRSFIAHKNINKNEFNISITIESPALSDGLGVSKLDLEIEGWINYEDSQNLKLILNTPPNKDFDIDIRKKDPILYFKINKLPPSILALLGIDSEKVQPLLQKWVSLDTSSMQKVENQKGKNLESPNQESPQELIEKYIGKEILSQIKIEKIKKENKNFFKISLDADKNLLDKIKEKLISEQNQDLKTQSETLYQTIKNLKIEALIQEKTYLVQQISISSQVEFDQEIYPVSLFNLSPNLPENSKTLVSLDINLGNFNSDKIVDIPQEYITTEEFLSLVNQTLSDLYTSGEEGEISDDSKRKSDILIISSGLELFKMDCKRYPNDLQTLLNTTKANYCPNAADRYLVELPKDPNGRNYFYQVSSDFESYHLCAKLDSPDPRYQTCPDENYNYHVTSP